MFGLTTLAQAAGVASQEDFDSPSVAVVNGRSIPQERLELRVKIARQQGQSDTAELRKAIRDDLINLEVISQFAVSNKLDQQNKIRWQIKLASQTEMINASGQEYFDQQLELIRQAILAEAYAKDFANTHPIGDEILKQEYELLKKRVGNKEYRLSHILVGTRDEAMSALAEVGTSQFADVAQARSNDVGSREKGGDLGWAIPSNFVQSFADVALTLGKGQVSGPVQTQFGWHIIKLEDTRELKVPTFDEIKPNLNKQLQQQAIQNHIAYLRGKAKVE
ncbi:MAG: peptidylprolyl isomerase [Gallionellales bacterium RIFOXYD2_FULL_52_7]|nr:MAG: peptidylprolyl isomerase [Gallionellales bacterium RIFOXYD2_FULL_52_7]